MGVLGDRLIVDGTRYRLRSDGRTVSDLMGRLESGELPAAVVAPGAVTPADVVAALAHDALGADDATGLPLVQASPPRPAAGAGALGAGLGGGVPAGRAPVAAGAGGRAAPDLRLLGRQPRGRPAGRRPGRAGRSRPTGTASRIAASPTRATPPTGSAGSAAIPLFSPLAEAARPLLDEHGDAALAARLLAGGWNAMAMIDLCSQAQPGSPREVLARRLQRLEMWLLLEATFAAMAVTYLPAMLIAVDRHTLILGPEYRR